MTAPPDKTPDSAIRALSRDLAYAPDAKLLSVVSLVDALPNRGAADALIAPLRPRLARLRPGRTLSFTRLLFLPFDSLIVPTPQWRPTDATIPRSVLTALAATVRTALGPAAQQIENLIAGRFDDDRFWFEAAGALLWPRAGRILLSPTPSAAWDETGLSAGHLAPLAQRIGAVLFRLSSIDALAIDAERHAIPPDADSATSVLAGIDKVNPDACGMAIALLIARLPQIRSVLNIAADRLGNSALRRHCDSAIETLLDRLETGGGTETQITATDLPEAGGQVRRIATLLAEGEAITLDQAGRDRIQALRQRLDASCQLRFADGLETTFLVPLRRLSDSAAVTPTEALESAARALRELELEARAIGGGDVYDSLLRDAADAVRALGSACAIDIVDQSRLVEMLTGPEAALAMFAARHRSD